LALATVPAISTAYVDCRIAEQNIDLQNKRAARTARTTGTTQHAI
jgi:hypothetical protein